MFRCFSFIKACSSKGCNVGVKRSQSQGELMWWLWTMCQPQLASPRMRLGLSCCSSSCCVSPVTVIKGISLLESQSGMVGLHFVQFSLMTKSWLLTKENLFGRDFLPFKTTESGGTLLLFGTQCSLSSLLTQYLLVPTEAFKLFFSGVL